MLYRNVGVDSVSNESEYLEIVQVYLEERFRRDWVIEQIKGMIEEIKLGHLDQSKKWGNIYENRKRTNDRSAGEYFRDTH